MRNVFHYTYDCTIVSPSLAKKIGLNEAIILQKLNDLVKLNKNDTKCTRNGSIWIKQSVSELRNKYFPFMSASTIKRSIAKLRNMKLIKVDKSNSSCFENTNCYAVDYEAVNWLIMDNTDDYINEDEVLNKIGQNELIDEDLLKALEEMEI